MNTTSILIGIIFFFIYFPITFQPPFKQQILICLIIQHRYYTTTERAIPLNFLILDYNCFPEKMGQFKLIQGKFLTGLFNAMYDELPAPKPKKKVPTPKVDTSQSFVKCPYGHHPSVGRQRGLFFMHFLSSKKLDEFFRRRKTCNTTISNITFQPFSKIRLLRLIHSKIKIYRNTRYLVLNLKRIRSSMKVFLYDSKA